MGANHEPPGLIMPNQQNYRCGKMILPSQQNYRCGIAFNTQETLDETHIKTSLIWDEI